MYVCGYITKYMYLATYATGEARPAPCMHPGPANIGPMIVAVHADTPLTRVHE